MTKKEYQEAISTQRNLRVDALSDFAQLTMVPINNELLIENAQIAYNAYQAIKSLKSEMNAQYPHICSCQCGKNLLETEGE